MDVRDILYRRAYSDNPTNGNPELHDQSLLCVTDLKDCCESPHAVHGDWYYPNGSVVQFEIDITYRNKAFRRNRGPNKIVNGRQFYGSVRLFRRWRPPERGRFRCELPSAANPSVNQTLYVYICEF